MPNLTLADGRELTLEFDLDAFIEAESAYGKPMRALLADAKAGFIGSVRALLYGGLRKHHPEVTPALAGEIAMSRSEAAADALADAIEAAFPKQPVEKSARSKKV